MCDHNWEDRETITQEVMRDFWKYWERNVCTKCLEQVYVAVKTKSGYTGSLEYLDGTERRRSLND